MFGCHSLKAVSAAPPSAAVFIEYSGPENTCRRTRRICVSSSTTKTLCFSLTGPHWNVEHEPAPLSAALDPHLSPLSFNHTSYDRQPESKSTCSLFSTIKLFKNA